MQTLPRDSDSGVTTPLAFEPQRSSSRSAVPRVDGAQAFNSLRLQTVMGLHEIPVGRPCRADSFSVRQPPCDIFLRRARSRCLVSEAVSSGPFFYYGASFVAAPFFSRLQLHWATTARRPPAGVPIARASPDDLMRCVLTGSARLPPRSDFSGPCFGTRSQIRSSLLVSITGARVQSRAAEPLGRIFPLPDRGCATAALLIAMLLVPFVLGTACGDSWSSRALKVCWAPHDPLLSFWSRSMSGTDRPRHARLPVAFRAIFALTRCSFRSAWWSNLQRLGESDQLPPQWPRQAHPGPWPAALRGPWGRGDWLKLRDSIDRPEDAQSRRGALSRERVLSNQPGMKSPYW